jgi:hypothetical protein
MTKNPTVDPWWLIVYVLRKMTLSNPLYGKICMKGFLLLFKGRLVETRFLHCDDMTCTVSFVDDCFPLVEQEHKAASTAALYVERTCYDDYTIGMKPNCPAHLIEASREASRILREKMARYDCTNNDRTIVALRGTPEYEYYAKQVVKDTY